GAAEVRAEFSSEKRHGSTAHTTAHQLSVILTQYRTTQGPHMMEEQQVYWNKGKNRPHSTVAVAKLMAPLRSL
ncbi:uncharacterized, partial [Tachysurus ichikawai]